MAFDGNRDLLYSRTPVTRNTAVTPSASVTSMVSPRCRAPRRKKTAGPFWLSTWPSMTDEPIWPGVAEYLYHAARPALVLIDGKGTVQSVHVGFRADIREQIASEIDSLLAGKSLVKGGGEAREAAKTRTQKEK